MILPEPNPLKSYQSLTHLEVGGGREIPNSSSHSLSYIGGETLKRIVEAHSPGVQAYWKTEP